MNLYEYVKSKKPPKGLGDAGDAAYRGITNAMSVIKRKKKKTDAERLDELGLSAKRRKWRTPDDDMQES